MTWIGESCSLKVYFHFIYDKLFTIFREMIFRKLIKIEKKKSETWPKYAQIDLTIKGLNYIANTCCMLESLFI